MRTPSGLFVLFQFCGENAGRVQFRPGPMNEARAHFANLVLGLDIKLTGNGYQRTRWDHLGGRYKAPARMKVSFVRYRVAVGATETWHGIPEETLSSLCQEFGDGVANSCRTASE